MQRVIIKQKERMCKMAEKYTEAQKRASYKYQSDKVKIQILVTPEQRERYKTLAEAKGLNLTQLIVKLLEDAEKKEVQP